MPFPGDKVRVTRGVFAGKVGIMTSLSRTHVTLDTLGGVSGVAIPVDQVVFA